MGLLGFIERGPDRRAWLDDTIGGAVEYLTPPNLRPAVSMAAQMNPIQGMSDSMSQFGVATDPNRSMDERRAAAMGSAVEGLLAVTPAALAAKGYMTPAQGVMEGLLGGSPTTQQIGDDLGRFWAAEAGSVGLGLPKPRNDAEAMARDILDLRAAGRASEVTDDMMSAADPQYMFNNTPLDMSQEARMARAADMGFGGDWYHGTTHDFADFGGGSTKNVEGHFGAGDYFTSSARDASDNYAGFGPDLTQRIEMRSEQLADEMGLDYDDPAVRSAARAEIAGQHEGMIIPAKVRGDEINVMPHTRGNPTTLEIEYPYSASDFIDEAKDELGADADEWDIRGLADDLAMEANDYEEPTGKLAGILDFIRNNADEYWYDPTEALSNDRLLDGYIAANDLDNILRKATAYAEGDGGLVGNDLIRQAYLEVGYPNIRMSADAAGWNMNIPEGTEHVISSVPTNIRSRFARFDPEFRHLANLSAGLGAVGLLGSINRDDLDRDTAAYLGGI